MNEKKLDVIRIKRALDATPPEEIKNEIILVLKAALKNLLASPEFSVSVVEGPQTTVFEIDITKPDFGRLVGSKGRTIGALRTLVMAIGATHNVRAIVRIKNEERFF